MSITDLSDVELALSYGYTCRVQFQKLVTVGLRSWIAESGLSVAIDSLQPSFSGIINKVTYYFLYYSFFFFGSLYHRCVNELRNAVIGR